MGCDALLKSNELNFDSFLSLYIKKEEDHSNFIAWLLNNEAFFKEFMLEIKKIFQQLPKEQDCKNFEMLENIFCDEEEILSYGEKTHVYREYPVTEDETGCEAGRIDIFTINYQKKFISIIENKKDTDCSSCNQLIKYANYANKYEGYKILPIFLKPNIETNKWVKQEYEGEIAYYIPCNYEVIKNLIKKLNAQSPQVEKMLISYERILDKLNNPKPRADENIKKYIENKYKKEDWENISDYSEIYFAKNILKIDNEIFTIQLAYDYAGQKIKVSLHAIETKSNKYLLDIITYFAIKYNTTAFSKSKDYYYASLSDVVNETITENLVKDFEKEIEIICEKYNAQRI